MAAEKPGERNEIADRSVANAASASQFLTVAEVASLMRVSKMTVYRLVHNGELPAVRVGRSFRVHAKAVHEYLETSYFDAG
ncbi:DNA-binding protein [Gordonia spumicola]|uniref:DNA-binding protein n=1 Tax=Gordonia spumicola TaxID=589161 RepID=A0A7I9V364_9ACTN|nr:helix-turn-helix domain-containing protein [Gordonia spumicola]GED99656.1 DNA-binding protein [Gordonia spumicola]